MELFNANFETIIWRYHLLIAVVVLSFVAGVPFLALLALPIFLTAILGISFKSNKTQKVIKIKERPIVQNKTAA